MTPMENEGVKLRARELLNDACDYCNVPRPRGADFEPYGEQNELAGPALRAIEAALTPDSGAVGCYTRSPWQKSERCIYIYRANADGRSNNLAIAKIALANVTGVPADVEQALCEELARHILREPTTAADDEARAGEVSDAEKLNRLHDCIIEEILAMPIEELGVTAEDIASVKTNIAEAIATVAARRDAALPSAPVAGEDGVVQSDRDAAAKFISPSDGDFDELAALFAKHRLSARPSNAREVALEEAFTKYDAEIAACPANKQFLGEKPCPKCGATDREGCRKEGMASIGVIQAARALSAKSGER